MAITITNRNYAIIVKKLDTTHGAPHGRASYGHKYSGEKIYSKSVPLIDGYDKGGAYWGTPSNLYVEFNADMSYVCFFRKR